MNVFLGFYGYAANILVHTHMEIALCVCVCVHMSQSVGMTKASW